MHAQNNQRQRLQFTRYVDLFRATRTATGLALATATLLIAVARPAVASDDTLPGARSDDSAGEQGAPDERGLPERITTSWVYPFVDASMFREMLDRFQVVEPDREARALEVTEAYARQWHAVNSEYADEYSKLPAHLEAERLRQAIREKRQEIAPHGIFADLVDKVKEATAPLQQELIEVERTLSDENLKLRRRYHYRNLEAFETWLAAMRDDVFDGEVEVAERLRRLVYRRCLHGRDTSHASTKLRNVDLIDLADEAMEEGEEFFAVFNGGAQGPGIDEPELARIREEYQRILLQYELDLHVILERRLRARVDPSAPRGRLEVGSEEFDDAVEFARRNSPDQITKSTVEVLALWAEMHGNADLRRQWETRYYRARSPSAVHTFWLDEVMRWVDSQPEITQQERDMIALLHEAYVTKRHELIGDIVHARLNRIRAEGRDHIGAGYQRTLNAARAMIAVERWHERSIEVIHSTFQSPEVIERFDAAVRAARQDNPGLFRYQMRESVRADAVK